MNDETGWQSDGSYVPCPDCKVEPRMYDGPGTAVHMPGTVHDADCPRVPHLSPEAEAKLLADLREIDECRRRAWANARNYVIGYHR